MPPDPEAELQAGATVAVELPPCHGVPGPYLGELPAADLQPLPLCVPEPPREPPTRGQCLMHNWQEERATNDLDMPRPECGTEGSFHRHGHPGLLTLDFLAGMPTTTTMKDSYPLPMKTGLPVRGKQEAMMEHLLYQKHSWQAGWTPWHKPARAVPALGTTFPCAQGEIPPLGCGDWRTKEAAKLELGHTAPQLPARTTADILARKCPAGAGHLQHPDWRHHFQEVCNVHSSGGGGGNAESPPQSVDFPAKFLQELKAQPPEASLRFPCHESSRGWADHLPSFLLLSGRGGGYSPLPFLFGQNCLPDSRICNQRGEMSSRAGRLAQPAETKGGVCVHRLGPGAPAGQRAFVIASAGGFPSACCPAVADWAGKTL